MPSYGPFFPAEGTSAAWGDAIWSSPGNVTLNDNSSASTSLSSIASESYQLIARDFGFNIPSNESVVGVEVIVNDVNITGVVDFAITLNLSGIGSDTHLASSTAGDQVLGGPTDKWGVATISYNMINSATFAIHAVADMLSGTSASVSIDSISVTVYTESSTPPQKVYPIATVSNDSWTVSGAATIHEALDETTPSDTDYAESPAATTTGHEVKVRMGALTDPAVGTGHKLSYRYRKELTAGDTVDLVVTLYRADGTTVVKTTTINNIGSITTGNFTLNTTEADSIPTGDYATGLVVGFKEVKV